MNKLLFVLLAICIIGCACAAVKRDTTGEKTSDEPMKELEDLTKSIRDQISKSGKENFFLKTALETVEKLTGMNTQKQNAEAPKS